MKKFDLALCKQVLNFPTVYLFFFSSEVQAFACASIDWSCFSVPFATLIVVINCGSKSGGVLGENRVIKKPEEETTTCFLSLWNCEWANWKTKFCTSEPKAYVCIWVLNSQLFLFPPRWKKLSNKYSWVANSSLSSDTCFSAKASAPVQWSRDHASSPSRLCLDTGQSYAHTGLRPSGIQRLLLLLLLLLLLVTWRGITLCLRAFRNLVYLTAMVYHQNTRTSC